MRGAGALKDHDGGAGQAARDTAVGLATRRAFLERAGMAGAAAVLAQVPGFLAAQGWLEDAKAASDDVVRDTLDGLVAFVVPGPDPYSTAQLHASNTPGGIAAGTTDALIETLDKFFGNSHGSLPSSGGIAGMLNSAALTVNAAATGGGFPSPFARLTFAEKVETFKRIEQTTEGTEFRYVSGVLIATVAFLAYSERGVLDQATRKLKATPVGWKLSRYKGPADARADFKGYWKGRRSVRTSKRYRVPRKRPAGTATR